MKVTAKIKAFLSRNKSLEILFQQSKGTTQLRETLVLHIVGGVEC